MEYIRRAEEKDIPRIAEILIFAKRVAYRPIFQDDNVSFNVLQVVSTAESLHEEGELDGVYVYDDGIVRGMIKCGIPKEPGFERCFWLYEIYVDPFFQHSGVGRSLMDFFLKKAQEARAETAALWVLEKNSRAREFYGRYGFMAEEECPSPILPGECRRHEEGTPEYLLRNVRRL